MVETILEGCSVCLRNLECDVLTCGARSSGDALRILGRDVGVTFGVLKQIENVQVLMPLGERQQTDLQKSVSVGDVGSEWQ